VLAPSRLTAHRYLGLAASALLAAGAAGWPGVTGAGALPGRADADGLPVPAQLPALLACLLGLLTLTAVWWNLGPRLGRTGVTGRWLVTTAAIWLVPLILTVPLESRDLYSYACQGALIHAGLDPHQVPPAALPCPWLDSVPPIWRTTTSPYGPLAGVVSAGAATVGHGLAGTVAVLRLAALVGLVLAVWGGSRLARACGVAPAGAAWLGAACPLVAVHAVGGGHHDALLTGLVLAASAIAIGREQPGQADQKGPTGGWARVVAAGAVLGLAIAVKITALVVLPFLALLATRAGGAAFGWRRLLGRAALVSLSAATSLAALAIGSGLGLGFLRGLSHAGDLAQWTSIPTALGMSAGYLARAAGHPSGYQVAIDVARVIGLASAVALIAAAWWWAVRPAGRADPPHGDAPGDAARRTVVAAGVAFAAVVLLGPAFYPWYALAPLALLAVGAGDRIRPWLGAAAALLAFLVLPDGVGLAPLTKLPGALVVTAGVLGAVVASRRRLASPSRRPRLQPHPHR
jgi:alpha-1,6-mannosyltransferase